MCIFCFNCQPSAFGQGSKEQPAGHRDDGTAAGNRGGPGVELALSRGLRQPLQRLLGQLDQIDFSSSDLPRISDAKLKRTELVRLQRALNDSLERIDEGQMAREAKNRDLDEINQNLEQTVEERTAELSAAYVQISKGLAVRKQIEKELVVKKGNEGLDINSLDDMIKVSKKLNKSFGHQVGAFWSDEYNIRLDKDSIFA